MNRRNFLIKTAAAGMALAYSSNSTVFAQAKTSAKNKTKPLSMSDNKLTPPAKGPMLVAIPITSAATVIDFSGPWEVFQDVFIPTRGDDMDEAMPFKIFFVAETTEPVRGSGGIKLSPDYTFETAPQARVVVVPAQVGSPALYAWLRKVAPATDVMMSVCQGAFHLGRAGLLTGKSATTHHDFFDRFAKEFPGVDLKRGVRFVEGAKISTSAGLSSGIDLALRVVERYFGHAQAKTTADYMEYQGTGWIV